MKSGTLARELWPLMEIRSRLTNRCVICGRTWPLNFHHLVRRGAGNLYEDGVVMPKPLITLCGSGNVLHGPDGETYCHGLAHHNMLHFRNHDGRLQYRLFDEPIKYGKALEMDGWQDV